MCDSTIFNPYEDVGESRPADPTRPASPVGGRPPLGKSTRSALFTFRPLEGRSS